MKRLTWRDFVVIGLFFVYVVTAGIICYIGERIYRNDGLRQVNVDLYGEVCYMQGYMDAVADKKPDYQAVKKQYMKGKE